MKRTWVKVVCVTLAMAWVLGCAGTAIPPKVNMPSGPAKPLVSTVKDVAGTITDPIKCPLAGAEASMYAAQKRAEAAGKPFSYQSSAALAEGTKGLVNGVVAYPFQVVGRTIGYIFNMLTPWNNTDHSAQVTELEPAARGVVESLSPTKK